MTKQQLEEKLSALKAEASSIREFLGQVKAKEERLRELTGHWHYKGLIHDTRIAIRDAGFPVWNDNGHRRTRIVSVTDKSIVIRWDGLDQDDVSRYRRSDGRRQGIKTPYDTIDVTKALRTWEEHQKAVKQEETK